MNRDAEVTRLYTELAMHYPLVRSNEDLQKGLSHLRYLRLDNDLESLQSIYEEYRPDLYQQRIAGKRPKPRKLYRAPWQPLPTEFFERNGVLWVRYNRKRWIDLSAGYEIDSRERPAPRQVNYGAKGIVYRTLVLNYLRTGVWLDRLPVVKPRVKTWRGRVRIDGRQISLGYFASEEERDLAVAMAKIGLFVKQGLTQ